MKKLIFLLGTALLVVVIAAIMGDAETIFVVSGMITAIAPIAVLEDSPSHLRVKKLSEQRGRLHKQMKDLNDLAAKEERGFTKEETEKYGKMGDDFQSLDDEIRRLANLIDQDSRMAEISIENKENEDRKLKETGKKEVNFRDWFSKLGTTETEIRAAGLSVGEEGDYAVPVGFLKKVEEALLAFGGMYANSYVYKTDGGGDLTVPTINDTGNVGAVLAEATTIGTSVDPTLGSLTMKAYKISSKPILVSHEMLQDNVIMLENFIARAIATRIMRGANALFTTGAGTTTIQGVVTGSTSSGITPAVAAITYDNLVDLMHSVDPEYRMNGKWMFNDSTLKAIRKLTDDYGHPIWQPNITQSEPALLLGKPYIINQSVASIGASAKSALFGDFSKYFIREVNNPLVLRLKERYADLGQEAFIMFKRFDGQVLDAGTHPIKYWTHAAS